MTKWSLSVLKVKIKNKLKRKKRLRLKGKEGLLLLSSTCVWRKSPVPKKPEQFDGSWMDRIED